MLRMVAKGTTGEKPVTVIMLVLSHANLEELKKGHPVRVRGEDVHTPGYAILIFSGETEQAIAREVHEPIGPETAVHIDPRLRASARSSRKGDTQNCRIIALGSASVTLCCQRSPRFKMYDSGIAVTVSRNGRSV